MRAILKPIYETHIGRHGEYKGKEIKTVEHLIIYFDGYPQCMAHVDLLHDLCVHDANKQFDIL